MHARFLTLFIEWLGFYCDGMTGVIRIILYQAQNGRGGGVQLYPPMHMVLC